VQAETQAMLLADARVEKDSYRVRLVRFGSYSLDIEVFAYVSAADYPAFLGVQEELLLRIMGIVRSAGTGLAFPSQTMYVRADPQTPAVVPSAAPE
jgi:MscS family membrane protein